MGKKYKLTKIFKYINGTKVYRIQALQDFNNVNKGDLGGYVCKSSNIKHSWIDTNSVVIDSTIESSDIQESVLENCTLYDTRIYCSDIKNIYSDESTICDSLIYKTDICKSKIENCNIIESDINKSQLCHSELLGSKINNMITHNNKKNKNINYKYSRGDIF